MARCSVTLVLACVLLALHGVEGARKKCRGVPQVEGTYAATGLIRSTFNENVDGAPVPSDSGASARPESPTAILSGNSPSSCAAGYVLDSQDGRFFNLVGALALWRTSLLAPETL
jgi:hypothetical protein